MCTPRDPLVRIAKMKMPIFLEIGPAGIKTVIVETEITAERSASLRFLAGHMDALDRLDRELRSSPVESASPRNRLPGQPG